MARKPLRAVGENERRRQPMSLLEAVESGDALDLLLAQRRLIAESLSTAGDSVRPQLSNELTKLNALIATERSRMEADGDDDGATAQGDEASDAAFDASAL